MNKQVYKMNLTFQAGTVLNDHSSKIYNFGSSNHFPQSKQDNVFLMQNTDSQLFVNLSNKVSSQNIALTTYIISQSSAQGSYKNSYSLTQGAYNSSIDNDISYKFSDKDAIYMLSSMPQVTYFGYQGHDDMITVHADLKLLRVNGVLLDSSSHYMFGKICIEVNSQIAQSKERASQSEFNFVMDFTNYEQVLDNVFTDFQLLDINSNLISVELGNSDVAVSATNNEIENSLVQLNDIIGMNKILILSDFTIGVESEMLYPYIIFGANNFNTIN